MKEQPQKEKTPQPEKPQKQQQETSRPEERSKQSFASDADLFAVPRLPKKSTASSGFSSGFDMLDEMDALFETAKIEKTPVVDSRRRQIPRRFEYETSPPPSRGQSSSSQAYQRDHDSRSYFNDRYDDDRSRMSRRDGTFSRYDSGRDESRMSRKRGLVGSVKFTVPELCSFSIPHPTNDMITSTGAEERMKVGSETAPDTTIDTTRRDLERERRRLHLEELVLE